MKRTQPGRSSGSRAHREVAGENGIKELHARILKAGLYHDPAAKNGPDWKGVEKSLREFYGMDSGACQAALVDMKRLWFSPLAHRDFISTQVVFLHCDLPRHEAGFSKRKDQDGLLLARAFRIVVEITMQAVIMFPVDSVGLGDLLRRAISEQWKAHRPVLMPLVKILTSFHGEQGASGYNNLRLARPLEVAVQQHRAFADDLEDISLGSYKSAQYGRKLRANPMFWKEWAALKKVFRKTIRWNQRGTLLRSPTDAKIWLRPESSPLIPFPMDTLRLTFDLFCWKWFLRGMKKDEPLIEKPHCKFLPYGTAIVIPGYWSLDKTRDLDWKKIMALHRARGVERQGEKLDLNREQIQAQKHSMGEAYKKAKRLGMHGDELLTYVKKNAKPSLHFQTDDSYVWRLLRSARR